MTPYNPPDLNEATMQEIFDYIVKFQRDQGEKAGIITKYLNEGGGEVERFECRYRFEKEDGRILRCAAGCCIPDDRYYLVKEGEKAVSNRGALFNFEPAENKMGLLQKMQRIHDSNHPCLWETEWKDAAKEFELNYTEPSYVST